MYGSSEEVLGFCLQELGQSDQLFSATKVWTSSVAEGEQQIKDSHSLWQLPMFDLFQVHNLVGWEDHLPRLLEMKSAGSLRYVGITTSHGRRHRELEKLMRSQPLDFVQLTYNVLDRDAESRLLPLAKEKGIAVIVNRPFRRGGLFDKLGGKALPPVAEEIGCENWAQFFLKFVISHDAVTCAIPATSQVAHMKENMGAGIGPLPDAAIRKRMIDAIASI